MSGLDFSTATLCRPKDIAALEEAQQPEVLACGCKRFVKIDGGKIRALCDIHKQEYYNSINGGV